MKFDPDIITRLVEGDTSALDEPVEFDDGTVKAFRDCDRYDLAVMDAWAKFKGEEGRIRIEQLDGILRDRRHLRAVPREAS